MRDYSSSELVGGELDGDDQQLDLEAFLEPPGEEEDGILRQLNYAMYGTRCASQLFQELFQYWPRATKAAWPPPTDEPGACWTTAAWICSWPKSIQAAINIKLCLSCWWIHRPAGRC